MIHLKVGDFILIETYEINFEIGEVLWRGDGFVFYKNQTFGVNEQISEYYVRARGSKTEMMALWKKAQQMANKRNQKCREYEMEAAKKCGALAQEIRSFIKSERISLDQKG